MRINVLHVIFFISLIISIDYLNNLDSIYFRSQRMTEKEIEAITKLIKLLLMWRLVAIILN